MSGLNGSLTITAANSTRALKSEDVPLTVSFTPSELGLVGVPANKLPKSIKVPAKKVEEKVFRQFGLSEAQVKSRLQTENDPFKVIKTGENDEGAWASFNPQTGKYFVSLSMTKSLHHDLTNRTNQIKTEARAADQTTQNTAKPNENFDGRDGINQTDFQRAKLEKLLRDAEILPTSFGLPTNLSDLNHVVVTIPPNVSPTADSALSAYIEKRFGSGNLSGQDKLDILSSARQNGVKVENLKISPNNSRVAEFDLSIESLLKLQKSYLDVQYKVNKDVAIADKIKHEMALNQFLLGAMQGAWDDVKGTYNTVTSPLQTIQQIREAVGILSQLSTEDLKNIITELGSKAANATPGEAAYGAGYVVGTAIVEIIAAKGAGAAISALGKTKAGAAFLARIKNLASISKLKIAETFSDQAAVIARQNIAQRLRAAELLPNTMSNLWFDPDFWSNAAKIAGNAVSKGYTKFSDFKTKMIQEFGKTVEPHLEKLYRESLVSLDLNKGKQIIAANGKVIDETLIKEAKEKVIQYVQENKVKELKEYLSEIGNKYGTEFQNDLKKTVESSIDNIHESRRTTELHDMLGGHTIYDLFDGKIDTKHVGKTVQQLRERLAEQLNIPFASSFKDLETAEFAQKQFMKSYGKEIENWFSKTETRQFKKTLELNQELGNIVGRGKFGVKTGTKVEVVIERSTTGKNWFIMTSYPTP